MVSIENEIVTQNINIITKLITYSSPKLVSDVTIQQGHGHFSPFFLDFTVDDKVLLGWNEIINSSLRLYETFGCKMGR